jgi:hypothetical protein
MKKEITSKSVAQKFELKWSFGGPLSELCVTPPFSINFRCQIKKQVSDYRLLGASSFIICNLAVVKYYRTLWTVPFSRYSGSISICFVRQWLKYSEWIWRFAACESNKLRLIHTKSQDNWIFFLITPYIRILDFDWLISGVFFVYFHIYD